MSLKKDLVKRFLLKKILDVSENQHWQREKITLIKKRCHHYDAEWRLITVSYPKSYPILMVKPVGVILGLKMEPNERNLVISLAKEAGINNIYKSIINFNGDLDYEPIESNN